MLRGIACIVAGIAVIVVVVALEAQRVLPIELTLVGLGGVALGILLVNDTYQHRRAAAQLGLRAVDASGDLIEGDLPELGAVRVANAHVSVGARKVRIDIGSRLPDIGPPLAAALAAPAREGWTWRNRGWSFEGDGRKKREALFELVVEGIALAKKTAVAERMSPGLVAALCDPAGPPPDTHEPVRRELAALVQTLTADDQAQARRVAALAPWPEVLRALAANDGASFTELVARHPESTEAASAVALWIDKRRTLDKAALERLAQALRTVSSPRAEEVLLELLKHEDQDVRLKALASLVPRATPASIPALERVAKKSTLEKLRAEELIVTLRRRAPAAEAGTLALAADDEGALALAEEEAADA